MRTVLQQLSEKYQYFFIYDDALVDSVVVNCKAVNDSPHSALKKLLQSHRFSYEFLTPNTIIIRRDVKRVKPARLLTGCVRDAETGSPLMYANAYIQGKSVGSATDIDGNFSFLIPDSTLLLIVSFVGYETETFQITPQSKNLDISLRPRAFEFGSIHITASPIAEEIEQISRTQLNEENFIGVVGDISTEMTYASFMQYNDNQVYFNDDNFFIKITGNRLHPMIGTDRNNRLSFKQNQVMINGFPLQMPFHTTIIPAMNQGIVNYDLVQKSNYFTTVFDVAYSDAYESVMDLHYRKGNSNSVSGKAMIDLSNSSFVLEGPFTNKVSWIFNGKKSHINDLLDAMNKNKWISLHYHDLQAQMDFQPADFHSIRINYLHSNDCINIDPQINYTRERMLSNSSYSMNSGGKTRAEEFIQEKNIDDTRFGLDAVSLYSSNQFSDFWKSEFTVFYAEQHCDNKRSWSVEHDMRLPEVTDSTYNYLWSEGKDGRYNTKSWNEKFTVYYGASSAYSMKAGVHFEQSQYNFYLKNNLLVRIKNFVSEPPNYNLAFTDKVKIEKYSWFYQEKRCLFPDLKIQTGIRYDFFSLGKKARMNPRIVIHYDLPKKVKTRVAFGTFSRLPELGEMRQYMLERFEPGYKRGDSKIELQYIEKYLAGIEKYFGTAVLLDFNYFYKNMNNLVPIQRLSDGSLLYDVKNKAGVSCRGFDVNTKLNLHMFSLMCRYKYTDSFENTVDGRHYPYYADQRHSLLLSLNAALPHHWHFGLQAIYGSGYAYTPCVLPEYDWNLGYDLDSTPIWEFQSDRPHSSRYPEYNRLDINFRKGFTLPIGTMTLSVNLINVLNVRHTFTYIYTYDQNGEPIRQSESLIPFFPQVGLAYEFRQTLISIFFIPRADTGAQR